MAILHIEEGPEYSHNRIHDSHSPIERKLGNLRGLKLAICVPELHSGLVFFRSIPPSADTVVSGPFDLILHGFRIVEMYCERLDLVLRGFGYIGIEVEVP